MNHAIAKTFITVSIAGIISRTVEWKGDPDQRANADWEEAERIINQYPGIIDQCIEGSDLSYQDFECTYGERIWHFTQWRRRDLQNPLYGNIIFD